MPCAAVGTGTAFLSGTLDHLDCQARTIGAYGYGALADPGSPVALALTGVLTIFIALFGIRLMLGQGTDGTDLIGRVVRVGLFLALATSWPAWRIVGYDLILDGPAQIAGSIGLASGLPGTGSDLAARLQDADNGIVTLTMYGSGRLTGGVAAGVDLGDSAQGIALADQTAFGSGRATFLATAIGAFGLLRVGAGFLLALAPLMAGLMLFAGTVGIFEGWLRGLVFCALGSAAFAVISGTVLALVYPWLNDALAQREGNVFTPSAPTELFVLMLAYAAMTIGALYLIARITFLPVLTVHLTPPFRRRSDEPAPLPAPGIAPLAVPAGQSHAGSVTNSISASMRRELSGPLARANESREAAGAPAGSAGAREQTLGPQERLGSSHRRAATRQSAAGRRRDQA